MVKIKDVIKKTRAKRGPLMTAELQVAKELYMQGKQLDDIVALSGCNKSTFYRACSFYNWKDERELRAMNTQVVAQRIKKSIAAAMPLIPETREQWEDFMKPESKNSIAIVSDALSKLNRLLDNIEHSYDNLASIMLAVDELVGWLGDDEVVKGETPELVKQLAAHLGRFSVYISKKYQK